MKIYILVGLPASGKSTYGIKLADKLKCRFIDDISLYNRIDILKNSIKLKEENIVISDINLCKSNDRENCKSWLERNAKGYEVEFIFFENNPKACLTNSNMRRLNGDDRKVDGAIKQLSEVYEIPYTIKSIPCYDAGDYMYMGKKFNYVTEPTYLIGDKNGCAESKL